MLAVLFLVSTSNYVDRNIIGVLLEPIKHEFRVSDTRLGLLTGFSFAIFYATLGIPVARLADRGNRQLVITVSLVVWSVMTAGCGLARSFLQLALARIGVGVGEAGALPPAQSLIADYYPPARRGKALGTFMMSATAGYLLGVVGGGQIAQAFGWRMAFLVVGLPGLALGLLTHFSLDEPRRRPAFAVREAETESLRGSIRSLLAKTSFVDMLISMVLYFLLAYGVLVFSISFLVRTYGATVGDASAAYGVSQAVTSVVGSYFGGALVDRMARKNVVWLARVPGILLLLSWPIHELAVAVPSYWGAIGLFAVGNLLLSGAAPAQFAAFHAVCGSKRRAMSVAVVFFFANLIGTGFGPLVTGRLSDTFSPSMGPALGLRYALMAVLIFFLPCGWYMMRSGKNLERDLEV